jgi:hypothetical protein
VFHEKGKPSLRKALVQLVTLTNTMSGRFGWVNASYVVGLSIINIHMRRALGTLTPYETFAKATQMKIDEEKEHELENGVGELSMGDAVVEDT